MSTGLAAWHDLLLPPQKEPHASAPDPEPSEVMEVSWEQDSMAQGSLKDLHFHLGQQDLDETRRHCVGRGRRWVRFQNGSLSMNSTGVVGEVDDVILRGA